MSQCRRAAGACKDSGLVSTFVSSEEKLQKGITWMAHLDIYASHAGLCDVVYIEYSTEKVFGLIKLCKFVQYHCEDLGI